MLRRLAVVVVLAVPSQAEAADPLRTYCMDGWAGELCFDVLTFEVTDTDFTLGGYLWGPGYPAGYSDHHGRGAAVILGLRGTGGHLGFFDPITQSGTNTQGSNVLVGFDGANDEYLYERASTLEDVSYLSISARVRTEPNATGSLWEEAACKLPGWEGEGIQTCRLHTVPEPGSLLLLATGLLGLAVSGRRARASCARRSKV